MVSLNRSVLYNYTRKKSRKITILLQWFPAAGKGTELALREAAKIRDRINSRQGVLNILFRVEKQRTVFNFNKAANANVAFWFWYRNNFCKISLNNIEVSSEMLKMKISGNLNIVQDL